MTKAKGTAVTSVGSTDVMTPTGYGDAAGIGFEDLKGDDLSVSFLAILQPLSPQVLDGTVDGAKCGMLFNTVTRELTEAIQDPANPEKAGVVVIPCYREKAYVEWVPRKTGGGFVGMHDPEGPEVAAAKAVKMASDGNVFGKLKIGDNDLIETVYVYCLLLDNEGAAPSGGFVVLAFTSTKLKPCKDWLTAMRSLKNLPPLFANRARIRTVKQTKNNETFYNFVIDPLKTTWSDSLINPDTEADLLEKGREFHNLVKSGMAKAAFDQQNAGDDEIPF